MDVEAVERVADDVIDDLAQRRRREDALAGGQREGRRARSAQLAGETAQLLELRREAELHVDDRTRAAAVRAREKRDARRVVLDVVLAEVRQRQLLGRRRLEMMPHLLRDRVDTRAIAQPFFRIL